MAGLASFHLVRLPRRQAPLALARLGTDRVRLARTPGLRFWRLLGTGRGSSTGPGADLARTALFAVWDDAGALDAFSATMAARWAAADEAYHVRLHGLGGHGSWRGFDVLGALEHIPALGELVEDVGAPAPVAVLTRAIVRPRHWVTFARAARPVSDEVQDAPGLLAVCGIGEAPIGRQATFSLWRSAADARRYATTHPRHLDAVRRTRAESWYGEELFARFEPFASCGTWDGRDPLRSDA
jgi:hypothetical protein